MSAGSYFLLTDFNSVFLFQTRARSLGSIESVSYAIITVYFNVQHTGVASFWLVEGPPKNILMSFPPDFVTFVTFVGGAIMVDFVQAGFANNRAEEKT